jgi:hypothetical protein
MDSRPFSTPEIERRISELRMVVLILHLRFLTHGTASKPSFLLSVGSFSWGLCGLATMRGLVQ